MMASFLLSEVYIVEKVVAAGHPDLEDLPCGATVCTTLQQAHCEAIRSMIREVAQDREQCEADEEESLRCELVKTMRRKGVTPEKRYVQLKEIIIGASRTFQAEKTYYSVKRSAIVPHREYDEAAMCSEALQLLGEAENPATSASAAARSAGRSSRGDADAAAAAGLSRKRNKH